MTASAGNSQRGTGHGWLRNLWRPVMRDGSLESSAQTVDSEDAIARRGLEDRLRDIWRFLGFGLMRTSVPLRTVTRSGEPIYARARLESARIEERYYNRQQISLNPSSEVRRDSTGRIKIVLPYDGEKYFTRQAHLDVVRAWHLGADPNAGALVGFLALTGYDSTDLGSRLSLEEHHGSVPIEVLLPPVSGPHETDPLLADDSSCVVSYDYRPSHRTGRPVIPVGISLDLDDPDTAEIPRLPESIAAGLYISITRQVDFKPDLALRMVVQLTMPRELAIGAQAAVSEVFIRWPTRTSLRTLDLYVDGQEHQLRYNPERASAGGLEWRNIPMIAEPEPVGGDIRVFRSPPMLLSIPTPGDLYRQNTLDGEVEVTVNRLLSGTNARLFDATGRPCRRPELELESIISTEFSLTLDDAFTRRRRSPHQQMHFGEVIPSAMRIDDIMTALRNQGFTVRSFASNDATGADSRPAADPRLWWLSAKRTHGPDTLSLLLCVEGRRYRTRRERQVQGGMAYNTMVDSGDLELYVYGFLPGDSKAVVQEMNALRRALRERFDRLPARR